MALGKTEKPMQINLPTMKDVSIQEWETWAEGKEAHVLAERTMAAEEMKAHRRGLARDTRTGRGGGQPNEAGGGSMRATARKANTAAVPSRASIVGPADGVRRAGGAGSARQWREKNEPPPNERATYKRIRGVADQPPRTWATRQWEARPGIAGPASHVFSSGNAAVGSPRCRFAHQPPKRSA